MYEFLKHPSVFEIFLNDCIKNGLKYLVELVRVCSAGFVDVQLPLASVHFLKLPLNVGNGFLVVMTPSVRGKNDAQRGLLDLFLEQVFFVEKKDHR